MQNIISMPPSQNLQQMSQDNKIAQQPPMTTVVNNNNVYTTNFYGSQPSTVQPTPAVQMEPNQLAAMMEILLLKHLMNMASGLTTDKT